MFCFLEGDGEEREFVEKRGEIGRGDGLKRKYKGGTGEGKEEERNGDVEGIWD